MSELNIALVEPRIPQNTGNVARTCAATGARLHLVGPLGFALDSAKLKRAGLDYWDSLDITLYSSLDEFLERSGSMPLYFFTTKARAGYTEPRYPDGCCLVFGREDLGLPEPLLLANPQRCVRIPMMRGLRSLNLSNSVAVGVYETLRQWDFPCLEARGQLHRHQWED